MTVDTRVSLATFVTSILLRVTTAVLGMTLNRVKSAFNVIKLCVYKSAKEGFLAMIWGSTDVVQGGTTNFVESVSYLF
jgi:hypothetical protein